MPSLSIKNVPEDVLARLKARADRNHRSLQGELMALITRAAEETPPETLTVDEFYERMQKLGRSAESDSTAIIREMRDTRYGS